MHTVYIHVKRIAVSVSCLSSVRTTTKGGVPSERLILTMEQALTSGECVPGLVGLETILFAVT